MEQSERKPAGVAIVNTESLNALINFAEMTASGKVMVENLMRNRVSNLSIDEVEALNDHNKKLELNANESEDKTTDKKVQNKK